MQIKTFLITLGSLLIITELSWSCNPTTYAGCSPEQLRAIQQQQFYARKHQPADANEYWRDRQYADRVRLEERNHEIEVERLRSQTAIEVARQERRSWRRGGYYFYRPPVVVHPKPVHPIAVQPRPQLRGSVYSNSNVKTVPNAVN
ncbi:MAG: hypothetical protein HKN69_06005 [Desulfofustis sp.]|nr:hypothetical protein [Desulfofustis sp.]